MRADASDPTAEFGAPVNRAELANLIVGADSQDAALRFGSDLLVLRHRPEHSVRVDRAVLAEVRVTVDDDVRLQPATVTEYYVWSDDAVWTDLDTLAEFRGLGHDGRRVNSRLWLHAWGSEDRASA